MKKKLRREAQARLEKRGAHWVDHLGITDWRIKFELVEPMGDCYAQVTYNNNYHQAMVQVGNEIPEEDWDFEILHELSHVLLQGLHCKFLDSLNIVEGSVVREVLRTAFSDAEEEAVNRLSAVFMGNPIPFRVP